MEWRNHPVISFLYWLQEEAQKDVLGRDRLLHFCFEETAHEIIADGCIKAQPSPCNKRKASACFMCGTLSLCSLTQGFLTLIKHHLKRHNQEPKGRLFAFVESMPEGGQSRPSEFQDLPPNQSLRGSTSRTRHGQFVGCKAGFRSTMDVSTKSLDVWALGGFDFKTMFADRRTPTGCFPLSPILGSSP